MWGGRDLQPQTPKQADPTKMQWLTVGDYVQHTCNAIVDVSLKNDLMAELIALINRFGRASERGYRRHAPASLFHHVMKQHEDIPPFVESLPSPVVPPVVAPQAIQPSPVLPTVAASTSAFSHSTQSAFSDTVGAIPLQLPSALSEQQVHEINQYIKIKALQNTTPMSAATPSSTRGATSSPVVADMNMSCSSLPSLSAILDTISGPNSPRPSSQASTATMNTVSGGESSHS